MVKTKELTNNERKILLIMGITIFQFYFMSIFDLVQTELSIWWKIGGFIIGGLLIWIS